MFVDLIWGFSHEEAGVVCVWKAKCHFHHVSSRVRIRHTTNHGWGPSWSSSWESIYWVCPPKLLLFSFLYCPLWKNQSLCNPHLRMESPHLSLQTCQYVSQQRGMKDEERQWEEGRIGMIIRFPLGASLVAQTVKNPLTMQETWVWFLGWEDLLEKGMATHSNILAWGEFLGRTVHGVTQSQTQLSGFYFSL